MRDEGLHPPASPPRCVRHELHATTGVEAQCGVVQPDTAFRLEIFS
jgi:hypothetical protein